MSGLGLRSIIVGENSVLVWGSLLVWNFSEVGN